MRDHKLSAEETAMENALSNPDKPNGISGDTIYMYKKYCQLLEQIVRLDMEVEALKSKAK